MEASDALVEAAPAQQDAGHKETVIAVSKLSLGDVQYISQIIFIQNLLFIMFWKYYFLYNLRYTYDGPAIQLTPRSTQACQQEGVAPQDLW